jgi:hypothetical protein
MKILCVLFSQTEGGREKRKLLHFKHTHTQQNIYTQNQHAFFSSFSSPRIQQLLHCKILSLSGVFSLSHFLYDTHNTHSFTLHNFSFLFSTVSYQFSSGGNPFFYAIVDFFNFFLFPFRFFS